MAESVINNPKKYGEKSVTTDGNGNFFLTGETPANKIITCIYSPDVSNAILIPYMSGSAWRVHAFNASGQALANTAMTVRYYYI